METLYDLLGALPRDDADELRSAFRRAVKGAHPDINPGDPDAGVKFRQIVRANEILADEEQRAAYDHLLSLAEVEQKSIARQSVARVVHRLASAVVAVAVISIMSIGSFALFLHLSDKSIVRFSQIAARAPAESVVSAPPVTPALPLPALAEPAQPAALDREPLRTADARPQLQDPPPPARVEIASAASETIAPVTTEPIGQSAAPILPAAIMPPPVIVPAAVTMASDADSAPPPSGVKPQLDLALTGAKSYRQQGIVAYRNGDLSTALAAFDQAIALDPKFAEAYIDRGIVLYRMRKFERAFADLAHAKKLDHTKTVTGPTPAVMVPPAAVPPKQQQRPRFGQNGLAFGMMTPRRTMGME